MIEKSGPSGNFNSVINKTKNDLKTVYDQVGPVTDVADTEFGNLVLLTELKTDLTLMTANTLEGAGGSLEDLETNVLAFTGTGTPEKTDPTWTQLFQVLSDFTALYNVLKDIQFVDVKLTGPMNKKHVFIEACPVVARGVIPSTVTGTSAYVYSPAVLLE